MKFLIIQENGRHEKNRHFRECFSLKRSLDKIGVESEIWGLGHENYKIDLQNIINKFDVILILENYDSENWIQDLSNVNKFKVFWSIDSHCNPWGHKSIVNRHKVNMVLNSIESHQKLFENCITKYFPNAYSSDLVYPIDTIKKDFFVGFCGSPFQYRLNSIELIEKTFNINVKKDFWVLGEDMVKTINGYKIHFNQSENEDINYRVFETLGAKTLLLTTKNENIHNFFEDMTDILLYTNQNEMLEKIKYVIENEDVMNNISENGYKKVLQNHTYDVRAKQLVDILKEYV